VSESSEPLLEVKGLRTHFDAYGGKVRAVDGVDLTVRAGETLCLVGESGSGKSVTARSILQLVDRPGRIVGGEMWFRPADGAEAVDLATLDPRGTAIRRIRGNEIAMIFQEPMSSLSPVHTIGAQIVENIRLHEPVGKREARERAIEGLHDVGITRPRERVDAYTFQLSGGMRQRAMIAMALACNPRLLIADEPTTALDVTTQAQILELVKALQEQRKMALMFITHDLGVVAEIADHVAVMNRGVVVEDDDVDSVFHDPRHPYTQSLLANLPQRRAMLAMGGPSVAVTPEATEAAETPGARRDDGRPGPTEPLPAERAAPARTAPVATPTPEGDDRSPVVLDVRDLRMHFPRRQKGHGLFSRQPLEPLRAVDGVSFEVRQGETLGLVGESGCGKTTLGRCLLRAYQPTGGQVRYTAGDGTTADLATLSKAELRPYRQEIRMVFQDPYGSLNPRMTVREVVAEPLRVAGLTSAAELDEQVVAMLRLVGLRADYARRYPHAFSGGERQRICIARALITRPRLVVADEAVSALDVSVRAQVLELLGALQEELDLTYLFISHDLSVVETIADNVAVMYFGKIVEHAETRRLYHRPQHPYTKALLSAVPIPDPRLRGTRQRHVYVPDQDRDTA